VDQHVLEPREPRSWNPARLHELPFLFGNFFICQQRYLTNSDSFLQTRTDPDGFEEVFADADEFLLEVFVHPWFFFLIDIQAAQVVAIRDALSPDTKLSCDEMGVILPDDNDPNVWISSHEFRRH
jgi:hypothetical protein